MTDGPLMITVPLRISMEGRLVPGTSGGGLPCEESHSGSRHRSLPWGLWRLTDGPLMITSPGRISMEGSFGPGHFRGGNIGFFACHFPPLRHLWNIVAESNSASKCASNGTWTNPVARREPSERGQKRRKMAKRGAGRRSFRLRATTRGRMGPKFSQSVEETPVHVLRVKIARSKKKKKKSQDEV